MHHTPINLYFKAIRRFFKIKKIGGQFHFFKLTLDGHEEKSSFVLKPLVEKGFSILHKEGEGLRMSVTQNLEDALQIIEFESIMDLED